MTCYERSDMDVVGKLYFQILVAFSKLRLQTALLAMFLRFCLFCGVNIFHGDRFMERCSDVVLFYEIWYAE